MINIGAYKKGSNKNIDYAVLNKYAVNAFLMQQTDEKFDFENEVKMLSELFEDYDTFQSGKIGKKWQSLTIRCKIF